jgi:methionyl-tRNA formyltransferase
VSPSPVKVAAGELGLPVSHDVNDALGVGADLGVVVAYGRIIPMSVLSQVAMINVHFSLLPRWRGAAPVERALLAGDTETGVCIMRVEEGLDTGVVYDRSVLAIRSDHSLTSLRNELVQASLPALLRAVTQGTGTGTGTAQQGEPTHAAKIAPSELQVQFTMNAREVVARTKLEAAWFVYLGKRVRVLRAQPSPNPLPVGSAPGDVLSVSPAGVEVACSDGAVLLVSAQPEGKNAMAAVDWANGARLGTSLVVTSLA